MLTTPLESGIAKFALNCNGSLVWEDGITNSPISGSTGSFTTLAASSKDALFIMIGLAQRSHIEPFFHLENISSSIAGTAARYNDSLSWIVQI